MRSLAKLLDILGSLVVKKVRCVWGVFVVRAMKGLWKGCRLELHFSKEQGRERRILD